MLIQKGVKLQPEPILHGSLLTWDKNSVCSEISRGPLVTWSMIDFGGV